MNIDNRQGSATRQPAPNPAARVAVLLLVVLAVLLLVAPPDGVLTGNEETYLGKARRFVEPEWNGPDSAFLVPVRARAAFHWPFGHLVSAMGAEATQILGRSLTALVYAGALAALFRALLIGALEALLVLFAFCLLGQQLIGVEWLFGGVEPKTLAYPCVLGALALVLSGRIFVALPLLVAATYWHFQVGFFWSGLVLVFEVWARRDLRRALRAAGLYALACLPLLGILVSEFGGMLDAAPLRDGATPDSIYSARNKMHTAPFAFPGFGGGVARLAIVTVSSALFLRWGPPAVRRLAIFTALGSACLALGLGLLWLDRDAALGVGKLYPLRPSSLVLLLWLVQLLIFVRHRLQHRWRPALFAALALLGILMLQSSFEALDRRYARAAKHARAQADLLDRLRKDSAPGDLVLVDPSLDWQMPHLERMIDRPTLVSHVYGSPTAEGIVEWRRRIRLRERIFAEGCEGSGLPGVRFLIGRVRNPRTDGYRKCGPIVFRSERYELVEVVQ